MDTTTSKEDYLKAIAEAETEGELVIAATLVRWLNVTPAAVSMALRRLGRDGFVAIKSEGRVALTTAGRRIAERILLRHHLIERMLAEMFGMEWYKVHDEAERLEHAVSADFEAKLIAGLGIDGVCPHGSDIRQDGPVTRRSRGLITLAEVAPDANVVVECLYERDRKLLEYLDKLGIRPRSVMYVFGLNPDSTIRLRLGKEILQLGSEAARRVWVRTMTNGAR